MVCVRSHSSLSRTYTIKTITGGHSNTYLVVIITRGRPKTRRIPPTFTHLILFLVTTVGVFPRNRSSSRNVCTAVRYDLLVFVFFVPIMFSRAHRIRTHVYARRTLYIAKHGCAVVSCWDSIPCPYYFRYWGVGCLKEHRSYGREVQLLSFQRTRVLRIARRGMSFYFHLNH